MMLLDLRGCPAKVKCTTQTGRVGVFLTLLTPGDSGVRRTDGNIIVLPTMRLYYRRGFVVSDRSSTIQVIHVSLIRFTVADKDGTTSFVGPGHAIKMFVAACANEPSTVRDLLDLTRRYDDQFATDVLNGLSVFDEHNVRENTSSIEEIFTQTSASEWPPFRVFNDATRRASTHPGRAGLIVINLNEKRIVQVQNSYSEILRQDRGRIRAQGRPTRTIYHYRLPTDWALVP